MAGEESKSWIAMGNMFLKLPTRQSRTMLAQDQVQLDLTVNLLRSSLKVWAARTLPEINLVDSEMREGVSVCALNFVCAEKKML